MKRTPRWIWLLGCFTLLCSLTLFSCNGPVTPEGKQNETTKEPTTETSNEPILEPQKELSVEPTQEPTQEPQKEPTAEPTQEPQAEPAAEPTAEPTQEPTQEKVLDASESTPESTPEPQKEASPEPGCPSGQKVCGNGCVDTQSNNQHCGDCNMACSGGQTCQAGSCACPSGQKLCGGTCVNVQTNGQHCGDCNMACKTGQTCQTGTCQCPSGQTFCANENKCVNLQTDNNNCGTCGTACPSGQACTSGSCATAPNCGSPVSFANDIQPIFNNRCIGCHGGSGGLFLSSNSSYSNLVNVTSGCNGLLRVKPSDPTNSYIYRKVSGMGSRCGNIMPPGSGLPQSEHELIRRWICQGAPNN